MENKENKKAYTEAKMYPNPSYPNTGVVFNPEVCNGCNKCVDFCRTDCLQPNPEPGKPPILLYPEECWFAGCCAVFCPRPGAVRMDLPINQRMVWKRKETGEIMRVGMKNPPDPNTKPFCG
ncbi:MAG TPA: 4Fe-4S binding protein [Anaerovoracaceae bacterium]|nr:4Fe-4S binding protein [Anaerovoracaceae bacterium]